jgi:LysR family glycine cleavage system transcriptional activator
MIPALQRRNANLIRQLFYFEAVARHQSVKAAAAELGVSQSAISHQFRSLSDLLGEQLLVRTGRGVVLTASGEKLAQNLGTAFLGLESSVGEILGNNRQVLRIAVCSSFGPHWLIPRLKNFMRHYPTIELQLRLYADDPKLTDQVADAIITAEPLARGFKSVHIVEETLIAVQAPVSAIPGMPHSGRELITTELEPDEFGKDWIEYCREAGLDLDKLRHGPYLQSTHYLLALEMAKRGLGVAIVPEFVAKESLAMGTLVTLTDKSIPSHRSYRLCYKYSRANEPQIVAFTQWIKIQASHDNVFLINNIKEVVSR